MRDGKFYLALVPDQPGAALTRGVIEECFSTEWLPYKRCDPEETGAAYFLDDLSDEEVARFRILASGAILIRPAPRGRKIWIFFDAENPIEVCY